MASKCSCCGIADKLSDGKTWCLKYLFEVSDESKQNKSDCYYFIEHQVEEGEAMTARQHLMLKEGELVSRRMKGPV